MTGTRLIELAWLPPINDFRSRLADARAMLATDITRAEVELGTLSRHRLDPLMALQFQRAAKELFKSGGCSWPVVRLALLGSTTTAHVEAPLVTAGARRGLRLDVLSGGFGQWRQELIAPPEELSAFAPSAIVLALTLDDVLGVLPLGLGAADVDAAIAASVAQLANLWELARQKFGAIVIQQAFVDTGPSVFGSLDRQVSATTSSLVERLNQEVRAAAARANVLVLDVNYWMSRHGKEAWCDDGLWHYAKQLIAPTAAAFYADLIVRLIAAARGSSSKCLVLDLDNTVWGGVVGDDGIDGLVLGQGDGLGEAFLAFQRYALRLKERGVILAVCSKNELDTAENAFRNHPEMVLKREDIAVFVANWRDKASNLRDIAQTLNIGLDSLVFCDDNPAERDLVRRTLPEVAVPELPEDCVGYPRCLAEAGFFESIAFTPEDQARAALYQASAKRGALLAHATDMTAFLHSLEMKLVVSEFSDPDLARIAQLVGKTNQFNLTTRRRDQTELKALAGKSGAVALSFRLFDKFGDNGLICVLLALPHADDPRRLAIDTWLMSCRVFGRQVEHEVMNRLVEEASKRGVNAIVGEYVPTPKNSIVRDLYPRLGFKPELTSGEGGRSVWTLSVAEYQRHPTSIASMAAGDPPPAELQRTN